MPIHVHMHRLLCQSPFQPPLSTPFPAGALPNTRLVDRLQLEFVTWCGLSPVVLNIHGLQLPRDNTLNKIQSTFACVAVYFTCTTAR